MKKQVLIFVMTAFTFMGYAQVAEAKKFGGGGSFGMFKKSPSKSFAPKTSKTPQASKPSSTAAGASGTAGKAGMAGAAGGAAAKSGASKWLGPLAGLAVGGLLAAMIFGDGFEGIQMMDFLLFGLVAFVLYKLFMRRSRQAQPAGAQYYDEQAQEEPATPTHQQRESVQSSAAAPALNGGSIFGSALSGDAQPVSETPAWFNEEEFVEGAKGHYMSLQKAWDNADINEIKSYCSSELFDALQPEFEGLKPGDNETIVDELNAEVAEMAIDGNYFVVSIRFSGFIIEERGADAHAFTEIWHIRRDSSDQGNWEVAGIQPPA